MCDFNLCLCLFEIPLSTYSSLQDIINFIIHFSLENFNVKDNAQQLEMKGIAI